MIKGLLWGAMGAFLPSAAMLMVVGAVVAHWPSVTWFLHQHKPTVKIVGDCQYWYKI
jgi:hypothetical protein